jgi:outer membrane protein assembly factor BamB
MTQNAFSQPGKSPDDVPPRELGANVAVQLAFVAGLFLIAAVALLTWSYGQRLAKDPLNAEQFKALKAQLAARPQDEDLKAQIRDMDRMLRSQYFAQRRFASVGAWMLLGGLAVLLASLRAAATLRRPLPHPEALPPTASLESQTARMGRWAVAGLGAALAVVGWGLALGVRSVVPGEDEPGLVAATVASVGPTSIADGNEKSPPRPDAAPSKTNPPATQHQGPTPDEIAKNWPRFRGPTGMGIAKFTNVPTTWDGPSGKNVLWKTHVPLEGNSSPVVWNDRIFLTGATDQRRQVFCFDATGKLLWQTDMPSTPAAAAKPPEVMGDTGFASPTPVTDGQRVYAMFAIGDVAAFDFSGKLVWVRSLGIPKNSYGHATSLAMVRNLLLIQFDQATAKEGKSRLLALDAATGNTVWETPRPVPNSWATPIVIEWQGQEQILTAGDPWAIAYQPADGKEIWRAKCLGQDVAASPVFVDGVAYIGNANAKMAALRVDGRGDVTESHTLWIAEDGLPDTCSPLATAQYVLLLASSGTLTCYEAKTGKKWWEHDFDSGFKASPTLVGKNVYLLGEEGKTWIVEPTPTECKIVAEANLGEHCAASPAFLDGRIYIRGKENLYCIGGK